MWPGIPGISDIPPPIGGSIGIGGGGGGGGGGRGGGTYGLPVHAASAGICMHCGSSGPVGSAGGGGGVGGANGLPTHWATQGIVAHRGSFGPVGMLGSGSAPATGAAVRTKTTAATAILFIATMAQGRTPTVGSALLGEFRMPKRCADERNVATVALLADRRQVHGSRGWSSRWNKPR